MNRFLHRVLSILLMTITVEVTSKPTRTPRETSMPPTPHDDVDLPDFNRIGAPILSVSIVCIVITLITTSTICFCYLKRREKKLLRKARFMSATKDEDRVVAVNFSTLQGNGPSTRNNSEAEENANNYQHASSLSKAFPKQSSQISSEDMPFQNNDDGYAVVDNLTQADIDNGYDKLTASDDPQSPGNPFSPGDSNHTYFTLEGNRSSEVDAISYSEDVHDYQEPFWEPATKEEELLSQIVELNVARISESCIEILECLGSGQFGMVHKAHWVQRDKGDTETSTEVAVKTMTQGATEDDKIKFLQEAAIMGQFHHCNILEILGIVMDGESLKIVVDLMHNGDLRQHLAALKECEDQTSDLKQMIMSFTRQIACGLSYMYLKAYVHRDLAARNVLVSEDGILKIADFGLSRDLRNENYYKSHGGKIPVKWTAPEALNFHKYSTASDAWSYGCLLYEIWSLGKKPFSQHSNIEAMRAISNGYRLPPPPGCPRTIYKLMIDCWHPAPESRPKPCAIITRLQRPDFVYLRWPAKEVALYSEESRTLGTPLENGHSLHMDLQQMYLVSSSPCKNQSVDKEPSSADLEEKNGEDKDSLTQGKNVQSEINAVHVARVKNAFDN